MQTSCINILIGGEAGQGLVTVGQLLTKSLVRGGYHVHVTQDYLSRIRGGHNTFAIRTDAAEVMAPRESIDILMALNEETIEKHRDKLTDEAVVLAGERFSECAGTCVKFPYKEISPKPIFENVAGLGALAALLGLDMDIPAGLIRDTFKKKGDDIVNQNLEVLTKAAEWVQGQSVQCRALPKIDSPARRLCINGNEAIALGAMAGGANFCSFYPMTPSTSIAQTLINNAQTMGIVVEQVEDEIAAINMALGAANAGARAIVTTSGGGFALMCEGVSLAGIMEMPVVVALAMRPGPATGLPTRTEQGDLNLALYAGHGEFPRAIYAPGDIAECFALGHQAFDAAEKFQSPVFILTDQYLADSYRAVEPFDLDAVPSITQPLLTVDQPELYKRYDLNTPSGVSPRVVPGFSEALVVVDSDEHDEIGHITEDHSMRIQQQDKRMRKQCWMEEEVIRPTMFGDTDAETLLVCWGTTKGPALEAMETLRSEGQKVGVLHFTQVWPLRPETFITRLQEAKRVVCVEGNATGQFADVVNKRTGFTFAEKILRYDGLPFTAQFILDHLAVSKPAIP